MDNDEWNDLLDKNGTNELGLFDGIPCECTYPGESDGTGRCCNCGGWLD